MSKTRKTKPEARQVIHFQHGAEKRTNLLTAVTAAQGKLPKAEKRRYYYNPHQPPVLCFDPTGKADRISALLDKARGEPITAGEHQILAEALRNHQSWLEWTGKREAEEKGWFEVDPVALNIHERISTQAILRAAVSAYRAVWRAKMDDVNACITANADQEELVDRPKTAPEVRVSGPFTVEGVMPVEADLTEPPEEEEDGSVEGKNTEIR